MTQSASLHTADDMAISAHALFTPSGDVPWASEDPYLGGNFLPVGREIESRDLPVVAGRIPPELSGAYMRNGPNPLFKPLDYAYPMDGDGMVHAVYLANGRARYRNRFVATKELAVERRAGRAIYGSYTHPRPVDPVLLRDGDPPGPFRNGAFINVISHAGRLLALNEATTGYELSMELETLGEWTAGTDKPIRLGAHNRHHPTTGEMFSLAYTWRSANVEIHRIDPAGRLAETFTIALPAPTMIHDFVLTERHVVLLAGPAVLDIASARAGGPMLQWQPQLGMRIAVVPLGGGPTRWIETEAFFVFHFANGFERGDDIVIDYVHHDSLDIKTIDQQVSTFRRLVIDPSKGTVRDSVFSDLDVEFPRIDERREALASRYSYMPQRRAVSAGAAQPASALDRLLKFDTETGRVRSHDFGGHTIGEAVFIPRPGSSGEDDGYLAVFSYDFVSRTSDFVMLDAARMEEEPVCVIRLPQRVPQGLHGNWIPTA